MASNRILLYFTYTFPRLLQTNFRSVGSCNIYTSSPQTGWFSKKKKVPTGFTIIKPRKSIEQDPPLLDIACKTAVVIGGSGCGFAAADHLLCKGALGVVILDDDSIAGELAAKKLCDDHGQGRAHYVHCDARDCCKIEAGLCLAICKYKKIHVIFNHLDKKRYPINLSRCYPNKNSENVASKVLNVGMQFMSKENGGPGGIIISCASLLGFINFPRNPSPIYCRNETAIETTMRYAKEYNFEKTGVRLITLCPVNKPFSKIALPCFSRFIPKNRRDERPSCVPSLNEKIGPALDHVIARAKNGTTWVVEPTTSPRENPHQIYFLNRNICNIEHHLRSALPRHSVKLSRKRPRCLCDDTARKKK